MSRVTTSILDYTRRIRQLNRNVQLFLATTALNSMALGIFSVAFNLYVLSIGIREGELGAITGAGPLATALVAIPVSLVAEAIGYKRSWLIILAITGATQLARVSTTNVSLIFLAAFIGGLGSAGDFVVRMPFLAENSEAETRALVFSMNTLLTNVATAAGTMLAGYLPSTRCLASLGISLAYRYTLFVASGLTFLALIPAWMIKSRPFRERRKVSLAPYFWGVDSCTVRLAFLSLFRGLNMGFITPFLNIYFIKYLGASREFFSTIMALAILPIMIGVAVGPMIARYLGNVRTITTLRYLMSVPTLIMAFTLSPTTAALAEWALRAISMMEQPLWFAFAMGAAGEKTRAATSAWLHVTFVLGQAVAAPIAGVFLANSNYRMLFCLSALAIGLAGALNDVFFGAWEARQKDHAVIV